jgi:hypothetical protein
VAVGCIAFIAVLSLAPSHRPFFTDFDPIRLGASEVLNGRDPYSSIGPGRALPWTFRLLYPLPAVLLAVPFVPIPSPYAPALFAAVLSGILAAVAAARRPAALPVFFSASWLAAVATAQWSPGLLAASFVPWLGVVLVAKPNVGLAVFAASRTRRDALIYVALASTLVGLSFIVEPGWFTAWRDATRGISYIRPVAFSFAGAPLLMAAARWREPEARLLLALSIAPINPALYEGVLLFAIPRSMIGALLLVAGSWVAVFATRAVPGTDFVAVGRAVTICMYWPALALVLMPRRGRDDQRPPPSPG